MDYQEYKERLGRLQCNDTCDLLEDLWQFRNTITKWSWLCDGNLSEKRVKTIIKNLRHNHGIIIQSKRIHGELYYQLVGFEDAVKPKEEKPHMNFINQLNTVFCNE